MSQTVGVTVGTVFESSQIPAQICCEVQVGVDEGLKHDSAINCDQITRLEKNMLTDYVGKLSLAKLKQLRSALVVALDIDDDPDADILDLT